MRSAAISAAVNPAVPRRSKPWGGCCGSSPPGAGGVGASSSVFVVVGKGAEEQEGEDSRASSAGERVWFVVMETWM